MKKNGALAGFVRRFQDILDAMDEFDEIEAIEEINAEFEDAIFLMENIDEGEADAAEEIEGALEEMDDILDEYRALKDKDAALAQKVLEFEMTLQMARNNLL